MLFGEFDGGDIVTGEVQSSDTGKMFVYDGRGSFTSEQSTGQRFLVEAFYDRNTPKWEDEHKNYLATLGFRLTLADTGDPGVSSVGAGSGDPGVSAESIYQALVSQSFD